MMFVRLAGCNVGKYHNPLNLTDLGVSTPDFPLYEDMQHSICTTLSGEQFLCDTDYHTQVKMDPTQIVDQWQGEHHVCFTGGEPFLHELDSLCEAFLLKAANELAVIPMFHFETSGTVVMRPIKSVHQSRLWVTCSPKKIEGRGLARGIFKLADEWKVLVGPSFDEGQLDELEEKVAPNAELYLQPINGVHLVWQSNVGKCLELIAKHPTWKLSVQLHKYLEVR